MFIILEGYIPKKAEKPIVIITGASGSIGQALCARLRKKYRVIGFDIHPCDSPDPFVECDLTSDASLELGINKVAKDFGTDIAAIVHLAAYFDFTGEDHPAYEAVNEEGTRRLLHALKDFNVGRFIYSGTMLVHKAGKPGERIDETTPIAPSWAYPFSKAKAEDIIREERGDIPVTLLHIAGLYDDETAVPTLSHQIARIYERRIKSRFYSGDLKAGQALIHKDDLIDAFARVVERRNDLPDEHILLIGEGDAISYQTLQDRIGELIHGSEEWATLRAPAPIAKAASALEEKSEPIVPDDFDRGEKPFIRPFMIEMASDHYALNIEKANTLLDWTPQHNILDSLPKLIDTLKADPLGWYKANGILPPTWMEKAQAKSIHPEKLRVQHERHFRDVHRNFLWAPFLNLFAGSWLITAPAILGYQGTGLGWSDVIAGWLTILLSALSLLPRFALIRWDLAAIGIWVMFAPLVFWTPSSAAYLNGTVTGMAIFGFAVLARPDPGVSRLAQETGPDVPPGWDFNPSAWLQRLPIIVLAVIGFHISRYLAAYQLGHIDGVWEPFFTGALDDPKNGTEEIITSSVSKAWPVADAGLGAFVYALEILTGIVGSTHRWRTMPWLVLLFGIMIVPLGVVSITFIIIQPIVINTWCSLCLIAAAAMLAQIPYSIDELVATCDFLWRKHRQGAPVLRIFFTGDTDEGEIDTDKPDEFDRPFSTMAKDFFGGGLTTPWTLILSILIGIWLMCTRLTLDSDGTMAHAEHLIGSLVVTIAVIAFAECARPVRFLNLFLGLGLMIVVFIHDVTTLHLIASLIAGAALIALSLPRGAIRNRYGAWSKLLV